MAPPANRNSTARPINTHKRMLRLERPPPAAATSASVVAVISAFESPNSDVTVAVGTGVSVSNPPPPIPSSVDVAPVVVPVVPVGVSEGTDHQGVDVAVVPTSYVVEGVGVSAMAVKVFAGPTGVYVFVGPGVGVFVFVAAGDVFVAPPPELVFVGVFVGVEVLAGVLVFVGGTAVFVGVFVRTGAPGTTRTEPLN